MRLIYQMWAYYCAQCGRRAKGFDARVPAECDETKCGPIKCGACGSTRFRAEKIGEAA